MVSLEFLLHFQMDRYLSLISFKNKLLFIICYLIFLSFLLLYCSMAYLYPKLFFYCLFLLLFCENDVFKAYDIIDSLIPSKGIS